MLSPTVYVVSIEDSDGAVLASVCRRSWAVAVAVGEAGVGEVGRLRGCRYSRVRSVRCDRALHLSTWRNTGGDELTVHIRTRTTVTA